jgi:hypothetical protein
MRAAPYSTPLCDQGSSSSAALRVITVTDLPQLLTHWQRMRRIAHVMAGGTDVDLRRAQRCVTEKRLHDVDGFASCDELHRHRVPERVSGRAGGEGHAGARVPPADMVVERGRCQRLSAIVQPHEIVPARAVSRALMTALDIVLERCGDLRRKGTVPHCTALAGHAHVGILDVEHEVANAQAAQWVRTLHLAPAAIEGLVAPHRWHLPYGADSV